MRLGAVLPFTAPDGGPPSGRTFADGARLLETSGYDSIWTFDAIGRGFMLPDALMALTAAATVTDRVELGTGVVQLPLRDPVELAHRALTLHHFAEGRFLFGVGPGSTADDFRALGADYASRFRTFDESLPRLRSLLAKGTDGVADLTPWATAIGGPALLLAAWRGPLVQRAAREADGWVASAAKNDEATLADALARYRGAGGRRAVVTNVAAGGDIGVVIERLRRLAVMGFDDVVVFDATPSEQRFRTIREALP